MTTIAQVGLWNASLVEMLWTLMGLVGIYFGSKNLQFSKKNIHDLKAISIIQEANSMRILKIVAYGHYRNDLFRVVEHMTITLIGAIAMIIPPTQNSGHASTAPVGFVVTGGLFTIVMLIIMSSILDHRQTEALEYISETAI